MRCLPQLRASLLHVLQCTEAVHLYVVRVVERVASEDGIGRNDVRERQIFRFSVERPSKSTKIAIRNNGNT
jgi:hypothetical protein